MDRQLAEDNDYLDRVELEIMRVMRKQHPYMPLVHSIINERVNVMSRLNDRAAELKNKEV